MAQANITPAVQSGIKTGLKALDELPGLIEAEIMAITKGIALSAFDFIVQETPQWSGSMAASTRIYAGRIDYSYTAITGEAMEGGDYDASSHLKFGGKTDISGKTMVSEWRRTTKIKNLETDFEDDIPLFAVGKKGDPEAIKQAYRENAGHLDRYDHINAPMGQIIFITNNVKHNYNAKTYAKFVEINRNAKGSQFLRSANLPSGMYAEAAIRFGNLGQLTDNEKIKLMARAKKGI
ncbi:hypothetical protein KAR91_71660 [Candidatus Pacearchaeota archaeon]|nr:hypothetical protein [Candidatus Pacearchaeota archaeon]